MHPRTFVCALCVACASSKPCEAAVIEYNNNRAAWLAATGPHARIDFTGFPDGTLIAAQYQSFGVTFTDGIDVVIAGTAFPNDGWGLYGAIDEIAVTFTQATYAIAVDYPGHVAFRLYKDGQLTYSSNFFGGVGAGFFAGLISDQPFDAAVIFDPTGNVNIDDLYFGPPIPAPGAMGLLFGAMLFGGSRRRQK